MAAGRVAIANRVASTRIESIGDLPGLKWWVEPDSIVATDAVDSWTDKSGNGNTLTATGADRPSIAAAALDGYNGVQVVAASSQRLRKSNVLSIVPNRVFSFGLVLRVDAVIADSIPFCFLDTDTVAGGFGLEVSAAGGKYDILHHSAGNFEGDVIVEDVFRIITYRFPGWANASYRSARTPTALTLGSGTFISYSIPGATVGLTLGMRQNNINPASATFIAGFVCDRYLTDSQIRAAENIWKSKYPTLA